VVTLPAAPPSGQSRVDLVIAQVRDHALDAGANNDFIVTSVTGVPAASNPGVPALPTNALAIAQVLVPGAVANLNTATVTDVRPGVLTVPPVLGYTEVTADQAALGNLPTNVTGLACAFTLPVARRVSVAAQAVFTHDASNNAATYLRIVDGATPLILRSLFLNANFIGTIACERTVPMAAGAHNIYVQAWTSAGSVNLNASDAGNGPQAAWIRATAAP
jgi:hypothetical protein